SARAPALSCGVRAGGLEAPARLAAASDRGRWPEDLHYLPGSDAVRNCASGAPGRSQWAATGQCATILERGDRGPISSEGRVARGTGGACRGDQDHARRAADDCLSGGCGVSGVAAGGADAGPACPTGAATAGHASGQGVAAAEPTAAWPRSADTAASSGRRSAAMSSTPPPVTLPPSRRPMPYLPVTRRVGRALEPRPTITVT